MHIARLLPSSKIDSVLAVNHAMIAFWIFDSELLLLVVVPGSICCLFISVSCLLRQNLTLTFPTGLMLKNIAYFLELEFCSCFWRLVVQILQAVAAQAMEQQRIFCLLLNLQHNYINFFFSLSHSIWGGEWVRNWGQLLCRFKKVLCNFFEPVPV